jgi:mono/diheme cytochrome c family protein
MTFRAHVIYSQSFSINKQLSAPEKQRMTPVKVIVAMLLITAFTIACARDVIYVETSPSSTASPIASATATPDEFVAARTIFKEQCSECHGANADGGQIEVEGKKLNVPSLKAGHALKHSDDDFVDQIRDGGDGMPAFKDKLQPNEINDLVRFIRKDFQGK